MVDDSFNDLERKTSSNESESEDEMDNLVALKELVLSMNQFIAPGTRPGNVPGHTTPQECEAFPERDDPEKQDDLPLVSCVFSNPLSCLESSSSEGSAFTKKCRTFSPIHPCISGCDRSS